MTPGNRYTYIIIIDNGFVLLRLGGVRNTFSLDMGALQKQLYFAIVTLSIHFSYYALQYIKVICIKIKYGCGHLGVATFANEILRMSEIALDPHLYIYIYIYIYIYDEVGN